MGIHTTFICDKCHCGVESRGDLLELTLCLENEHKGYTTYKPNADVAKAYLCKPCASKFQKDHNLKDINYDQPPDTSERLFNAVRDIFDELFQEKNNV